MKNRVQRAAVILAVAGLTLMALFPPVIVRFDYQPGPLDAPPFTTAPGVPEERPQTQFEEAAAIRESLSRPNDEEVFYRFVLPVVIGTASSTVQFSNNVMVVANYGLAWWVLLRNVVVLLIVCTVAHRIAAPMQSR